MVTVAEIGSPVANDLQLHVSGTTESIAIMKETSIDSPEHAPDAFQAAWNSHDMEAFGGLFQRDATFVNRFGHYVRGVEAILAMHLPIHETIYRDSILENEFIDAINISENVAAIHFWSRLTVGAAHPAGPHKIDTLILAVLTRDRDSWFIRALENVTLTNPITGEIILRG